MKPERFNIRVYGILIDEALGVLVCDELIRGTRITKFPGGGLELGEGTIDCLKREFIEEAGLAVEILEHFYTTDFYQQSAFNAKHQVISIYYRVKSLQPYAFKWSEKQFDFSAEKMEAYEKLQEIETFRFIPLKDFNAAMVDMPIDKIVAEKITGDFKR